MVAHLLCNESLRFNSLSVLTTGATVGSLNANLAYPTLLVASSAFREKSKSPTMAHEQGAQSLSILFLPKMSQDDE